MKIVVAPDSFKNCLPAKTVCEAVKRGVLKANPNTEVFCIPLADGGEGTADCFLAATGGHAVSLRVQNAYGEEKTAQYIRSADGKTALVEMAQAAGIEGIDKNYLHTKNASTYGVGQLILHAAKAGTKHIIVGLGGSATTDGGMGALAALGFRFFNAQGEVLAPIGANMETVCTIALPEKSVIPPEIHFTYACDVQNPFYGDTGAAFVFAKQKGADETDIALLDAGLRNLAVQYRAAFGRDISARSAMGAAGGLCGGLYAAFGGKVQSGFEMLAELAGLEEKIATADLVLTGEGRTDRQTAFGKLPARVAAKAQKYGVPCVLLSGEITADFDAKLCGFFAAQALKNAEMSKEYAIKNAEMLLENAAFSIVKKQKNAFS